VDEVAHLVLDVVVLLEEGLEGVVGEIGSEHLLGKQSQGRVVGGAQVSDVLLQVWPGGIVAVPVPRRVLRVREHVVFSN